MEQQTEFEFKVLDNKPILQIEEGEAIERGEASFSEYANAQVVRYPSDHPLAGRLVLDINGKVQYMRTVVSNSPMPNEDYRQADKTYTYLSPELEAEINGKVKIVDDQKIG